MNEAKVIKDGLNQPRGIIKIERAVKCNCSFE
jgi:hypothetical protein